MNAVVMRREARTPRLSILPPRPRYGAVRAEVERRRGRPLAAIPEERADVSRETRILRRWWAAFWLIAAVALVGLGLAIARRLESGLLGFLGADFVFLVVMSFFMSGRGGSVRRGI